MNVFDHEHNKREWSMFSDSSKASVKAILLNNSNTLPSVPIGYATNMKETYENIV